MQMLGQVGPTLLSGTKKHFPAETMRLFIDQTNQNGC